MKDQIRHTKPDSNQSHLWNVRSLLLLREDTVEQLPSKAGVVPAEATVLDIQSTAVVICDSQSYPRQVTGKGCSPDIKA